MDIHNNAATCRHVVPVIAHRSLADALVRHMQVVSLLRAVQDPDHSLEVVLVHLHDLPEEELDLVEDAPGDTACRKEVTETLLRREQIHARDLIHLDSDEAILSAQLVVFDDASRACHVDLGVALSDGLLELAVFHSFDRGRDDAADMRGDDVHDLLLTEIVYYS
jgi:hypothetical protein